VTHLCLRFGLTMSETAASRLLLTCCPLLVRVLPSRVVVSLQGMFARHCWATCRVHGNVFTCVSVYLSLKHSGALQSGR
jgi:hypothetical protein